MMKKLVKSCFTFLFIFLVFCGCRSVEMVEKKLPESLPVPESFVAVFSDNKELLQVYGNRTLAAYRFPPCSTFKIVSTLMGLDGGVLHDLNSRLGYDGTKYENPNWNQDVTLLEAFQYSCVPYYKKLTGHLKKQYVQKKLDEIGYGNCDLSVWNSNGHNVFWIESSLLISPLEQIGVLKRIFSSRSPFRAEHVAILKRCMFSGRAGEWNLYGKTGTGRNHNSNRLEAWFVGFAEGREGKIVYFAAHGADFRRDVVSPEIRETVRKIVESMP